MTDPIDTAEALREWAKQLQQPGGRYLNSDQLAGLCAGLLYAAGVLEATEAERLRATLLLTCARHDDA